MFGRTPSLTAAHLYSTDAINPTKEEPTSDFVRKNLDLYRKAFAIARSNLRQSILTQSRAYLQKARSFSIGDLGNPYELDYPYISIDMLNM